MKLMRRLLAVGFLLFASLAFAQIGNYSLSPVPKLQFFGANGLPLGGGFLYTCPAGTTCPGTQLLTYSDAIGTPNSDPVVLDSGGFASVWLNLNTSYKFCLQDVNGVPQYCTDNIVGNLLNSSAGIISFWTGPCTQYTYLRGDGICATPAGGGNITNGGTDLTINFIPVATGKQQINNSGLEVLSGNGGFSYLYLTAPSGYIDVGSQSSSGVIFEQLNPPQTPVQAGLLYKIVNNGSGYSAAVPATINDRTIPVFISLQALFSNNAYLQLSLSGIVQCQFDSVSGIPTAGDAVVLSTYQSGYCHDTGSATRPTGTYVIGVVGGLSGSGSAQVIISPSYSAGIFVHGSCAGTATSSSTLLMFGLGQNTGLTCTITTPNVQVLLPDGGTVHNLTVFCGHGGINTQSGKFTVLSSGGNPTILNCIVGTGQTCTDVSDKAVIPANGSVGVQFTTQASETLADCTVSVDL